jgi:hypothetical protein
MNETIVLDDQLILYWTIQKYEYYLAASRGSNANECVDVCMRD